MFSILLYDIGVGRWLSKDAFWFKGGVCWLYEDWDVLL